ncbi:TetR/AcrR family transcriptional regulator [Streptomyces sp. LaPpAH-108]|uniref:TetR/AcrR family transcriptional regulator n=1 Tax=Streptomyces sp. LaPpAH-108 TaxID=1155714 RepID=UPI0003757DDB|nr:TetR/AcrR family transcriptional regulator [Streptomyces sp. LaPpAH-108]
MPRSNSSPGRSGRPPATSRTEILDAARRVIERDGWEKLTVRRLAAEIGIGTTTLYHHVRDREDLLVQLLNEHVDHTLRPDLPAEPRERIIAAATAIHDSLAAWPWAAEILTVDGFLARLGPASLQAVETIVAGAVDCGCTLDQAVGLFRSVWYYTAGEILVRAHSAHRRQENAQLAGEADFFSGIDTARLPRLSEVGECWPELAARDTYPEALRAFVDGLLAQATSGKT